MLLAPLIVSLSGATAAHAQSIFLQEGFENPNPASWKLIPCFRPENSITADKRAISGHFSARLEVRALDAAMARPPSGQGEQPAGKSCLGGKNPEASYIPDGAERADVWMPPERWLPVDREAWYGFSMLVGGEIRDDEPRLVLAQWKQSVDVSPILALRLTGKTFFITLEQDGHDDLDCRVLVAYQHDRPQPQPDSVLHDGISVDQGIPGCMSQTEVLKPDGTPGPAATLPDPFSRSCWIDMIYRLKGSSESNGALNADGLLEVWAEGKPVARVRGRIGYYRADPEERQRYFKFGPYRDANVGRNYATTAYLDSFTRGSSYAEVDPARFPGRRPATLCK